MGKHFQIHVKTNIEKLQLQSYVIHKKFRDIIQLYEDIEAVDPEGKGEGGEERMRGNETGRGEERASRERAYFLRQEWMIGLPAKSELSFLRW